jgi:hypothetical protein
MTFSLKSFTANTVQNLAEQRELPGECPQKNTHSPDGLRRFRDLNRRSLNGIAFTAQPEAPAGTKAGASGWA